MTLQQYLQEDRTGSFANCSVKDLVPSSNEELDLLLLLESPHIDELRTGIPLSGIAGQAAFQAPDRTRSAVDPRPPARLERAATLTELRAGCARTG